MGGEERNTRTVSQEKSNLSGEPSTTIPGRRPLGEVSDKDNSIKELPESPRVDILHYTDMPEYHAMADFMDIDHSDRRDPKVAQRLQLLYNWGKQNSNSSDKADIHMALKSLTKFLGFRSMGPRTMDKLYRWIRLDTSKQKIIKEQVTLHE